MSRHAYQFLFSDETLFRVPEPEASAEPVVAVAQVVEPEAPVAPAEPQVPEPVAMQTTAEPRQPPVRPEPEAEPVRVEPVSEEPRPVVPQINQQVLLLFDDELTPSELILLENILKAVNLNTAGVDILNLAGSGLVNVRPVLASKRVHHFISFGVPFTKLNLNIALNRYEIRNLAGINFMLADPLSAIEADRALKEQLWLTLQQIFLHG